MAAVECLFTLMITPLSALRETPPAGFGGVVLSYLRDHSGRELLSRPADGARIEIAYTKPIQRYVKEYQKEPLR